MAEDEEPELRAAVICGGLKSAKTRSAAVARRFRHWYFENGGNLGRVLMRGMDDDESIGKCPSVVSRTGGFSFSFQLAETREILHSLTRQHQPALDELPCVAGWY
jgi:hypothetical protein